MGWIKIWAGASFGTYPLPVSELEAVNGGKGHHTPRYSFPGSNHDGLANAACSTLAELLSSARMQRRPIPPLRQRGMPSNLVRIIMTGTPSREHTIIYSFSSIVVSPKQMLLSISGHGTIYNFTSPPLPSYRLNLRKNHNFLLPESVMRIRQPKRR